MGTDLQAVRMLIVEVFTTITILVAAAGGLATTLENASRAFRRLKDLFQP